MKQEIDINNLVRKNIRDLVPYSSAREEYKGTEAIFMDANENPFNYPFNRYPDPLQQELRTKIAGILDVLSEQVFTGNGSDEAIDLLIRAFCEPGKDNIISIDPSYGMYEVCADINNVEIRKILLTKDFQLNTKEMLNAADDNSKLMILCSPNNPTSKLLDKKDIVELIENFAGLVIVDEAYIDFSDTEGMLSYIAEYKSFVILRTVSKAWGLAGIRLGVAVANKEIVNILDKIKYPYNINMLTQKAALEQLNETDKKDKWIRDILEQKEALIDKLNNFEFVKKIHPSDANFLLVKVDDPRKIYDFLISRKIIVRDRSKLNLCGGCLRITIGTKEENRALVEALERC